MDDSSRGPGRPPHPGSLRSPHPGYRRSEDERREDVEVVYLAMGLFLAAGVVGITWQACRSLLRRRIPRTGSRSAPSSASGRALGHRP